MFYMEKEMLKFSNVRSKVMVKGTFKGAIIMINHSMLNFKCRSKATGQY